MNGNPMVNDRFRRNAALNVAFVSMTIALSFVGWLGVTYLQNKLLGLERDTADRVSLLERESELTATSRELREQLHTVSATLGALQSKLPDAPEESHFLKELSERAENAKVSLGDFRPGGISQRDHCKQIELRLRATGSYASVCRWLEGLTNMPRVLRISQITIAGPAVPGGDCIIDIQLELLFGLNAKSPSKTVVKP